MKMRIYAAVNGGKNYEKNYKIINKNPLTYNFKYGKFILRGIYFLLI